MESPSRPDLEPALTGYPPTLSQDWRYSEAHRKNVMDSPCQMFSGFRGLGEGVFRSRCWLRLIVEKPFIDLRYSVEPQTGKRVLFLAVPHSSVEALVH